MGSILGWGIYRFLNPADEELEDEIDEDVLALAAGSIDLEVAADLAELRHAHLAEVVDLEVIPLTGGLELLLLFVFSDGGATATADGGSSSGSAVALGALIALVGAGCGHMGKVTFG